MPKKPETEIGLTLRKEYMDHIKNREMRDEAQWFAHFWDVSLESCKRTEWTTRPLSILWFNW